jgi:parallel beta-helix repeat protein
MGGATPDDTEAIQTALIDATSDDVICLKAGNYRITAKLSLSEHLGITLRGLGDTREDVVLDFADQDTGDDGMLVTADGFTIEHMWVKNTPGNGVVVKADDSIFRDLKVTWDAGSVVENGAYAVYPTNCTHTLVENVEVAGASDSGIYVGQCTNAIVHGCKVTGNVIGIETENTTNADVYDNDISGNTLGILAVILPDLMKKDGGQVLLRGNRITANNLLNFGVDGSTSGVIPGGAGILVMGLPDVEVRDNAFVDQDGPAVLVASYEILEFLTGEMSTDPLTDKWPKRVYVHDNTFDNVGATPMEEWNLIGVTPLPAVLWDGALAPTITTAANMKICLGAPEQLSFLKGTSGSTMGVFDAATQTTDTTDHMCTLPALAELTF